MDDLKQALRDFVATSNSGKYSDFNTLMSKFPELSGIDSNALKDFVATSNSGKYKSEDELFGKFPEFSFSKKKEESALPLDQESTLSATPETEPQKPSAFFVKGKIKTPSTFNKNVEDSDFKRHQDLYRSAKKSIDSGDRQAFLQSKKKLDDLRKSYGDVMANDSNLSEDYNLLNSLSEEKFKQEKKKELRFIQEEERVPVQQTQKKQLEKSIQGYESDVKYTPEERVTMLEIQRDLLESVDYDGIGKEVSDEYSAYSMKPIYTKIGMLSVPQVEGSANDAIKMAVDELVAAGKEPNKDAVLERASEIRTEEVKNKREYEAIDDKYKFSSILGKSEDQKEKEQALQGIKKKRESHAEMFKSKVGQLEALESQIKQYEDIAKEQGQLSDVERSEALDVFNRYKRLSTDIVKNYSNIENDTENIGDFDTELDAFKRNHTYLTSASAKSLAALERIGGGIAGAAGMVNNIAYDLTGNAEFYLRANDLLGIGKSIQDSAQGMLDGVSKSKQLEDIKDAGDAIEWAGALMVENTPQILINVLTNGQAIPFLAASSAGEKYMEVYGDENYSDLQKYAASILVGGGTAISEKLELAAFSKLWPSKRLAKAAIESSGRKAFEKSLSDGVRKGISDVFSRSKKALAGVNQEGVSEIADQLSRNLVDKYVLDKEDVSITDGLGEAYLSGAVVGAGLGAAPHVFSSIVRPFVNDPDRDIIKNVNKIQKLSESLEKADEKMKPIIQERIGQLRGRNEAIIQKAVNSFDSLTPSEVKEAVNIYEDITSLKKEYLDIKEDTTIPPDVKEALLESVFTKYNSLVERRLQILKKAEDNAVQEQTTSEVPVQPEAAAGPEVVTEEEVAITEEAKEYAKDLEETKSSDPEQYWSVDSVSEEAANEGTVITDEDGGVVVSKDGDIKGLFKRVSSKAKGVAQKLLQKAIDAGGNKLDNFDTYLTPIYKKAGFRVVSRIPFNEEYAPEGWNKEKHGTPDVVAMVYDPNNELDIEERTFDDYDEAMAYRNSYIDQAKVDPLANVDSTSRALGEKADKNEGLINFSLIPQAVFEELNTGTIGLQEIVSKAYHRAKEDGTNPELVQAVETLLKTKTDAAKTTTTTKAETGKQQTVAAEQGTPTTIEGTGLRENIKKSIAKVFKKFEVKSFKNAKEMAAYAKATYNQETGATDAARVFVGEQGVEILVNEELSDDTALGHEVWHALLLKAFGDNQKQFAAFRGAINKTLRENGYEDIADSLDEFTSEYTAENEVPAEEYLAQLGGLMTSANIDLKNLKPAQRTLLEQIKDIINEFAVKLTGQPVFLKDATAETILDFMSTMSDMMAKGEDISGFFVTPTKLDNKGNLPKPSSRAQKSLKDKNKQIENNTKAKVQKGDNVSTRVPSKGNPHSNSDLIVSTKVIIEAAKTDKGAKDYALKLANVLAQYPNVNINKDSIKTLEDAQNVFEKFKENAKSNLKWLYDQFSDEVRTITKLWYDGANIVSNEIAKEYGYTTNQVSGVMAVLSPQMDWFRNLSLGKRVIDIYNTKKESTIDDKMEEYIRNANTGTGEKASPLFEGPAKKLTEKSIDLLIKEMKGKKFKDMSIPEKAFFVRAYDEVYSTRDYENISPTGDINGFVMTEKGARAKVGWGGFGPIMKAISILEDGNIENISKNLGNQHKVRNFFVNISNPNDANAVTIDTHAVAAALLKPLAGSDAEVNTNLSGPPKSASTGLVGSYPVLADAYRELAKELGILPRELQSITWEAVRGLYKASFKTAKNKKAINEIWERYRNGEITINQLYEEVNTKAGGVSKPVWYEYVAEGDVKINEENSAAIDQGKLSDDYGGERPESDTPGPEVTTRAQKAKPQTIPGYDRMIGEAKSIVEKSRKRRVSAAQIAENVINYIQGSAVYERADDLQREQIIRDARKELGLRQKSAPSVDRLLGKIKDIKKVTVTEKSALKELLKAEAKGARTAVQARSQAAKALNDMLKKLEKKGSIKATQVRAIMTRYSKVNFFSSSSMDNFVNYMAKVFSDAEYNDKLKTASKTANSVRRLIKNASLQAGTKAVAKKFLDIDPRLVEDIDKYLEFAKALNEAVRTSTSVTVDGDIEVILKKAIDYNEFQDYMDAQILAQEEYIKNQLAEIHKDLVDAGVIDTSMSLADMKAIIDAINSEDSNTLPSIEKERMIRAYLGSVMDSYTGLIQYMLDNSMDPFSLELVSISQSDRDVISRFINMDLDKLPLKDAYSVVEAIENFIVNKNVDNMGSILAVYEGAIEAEKLQKAGTKTRPIKSFFSKAFGRSWAEQIEQLQITMERMFGGVNAGIKIMRASGILDISQGKTKATIQSEKILQKYTDRFGKVKDFSSAENIFERKIISFMKRTINGSDIQRSIEFERRKRIIEETIDAMEKGSESERRDAAIARKVYDKVLKDAKTPTEVSNNASDINNEAVDFWIKEFENIFDELQSVSRSVYNTILERDLNYTPDRFTRFDGNVDILDITSSSFAAGNETYNTNKSGTLMVNNRIKTLGSKPSRVLSFDFDSDMSNAMLNALIDVNTAYAIRKVKGFYESDSFEKIVGNKEDLELIKKRVKAFITKTKRKEYVPQSELAKGMKAVNLLSQIAVGRALGSLAQIPKQTISVMANTMINSDGKLSFIDVINAKEFIDNSGYSIALRGIASNADVQTINKILERESESNAQEIQRGLNKAAEMWLNSFIARPDVWAARVSWITYYKESLRKQGIDADNIDWSTHEMNQKAGDYAQAQVNRQQNYSDSDFAGELLGSKDPMKAFFRKVLFPYMTFVFNQKSRQMADIAILSNRAASTEDKKIARKSLAGLAVEMGMYSLVGYFVKEVYAAIVNAVTGDEDEEEDKDKRLSNHLKYNSKTIINDLLSPIPNITDAPLDLAINKIMKISGLDEEKFSIPLDQDKSLAEVAVGPSSIIFEGALNLERMSYAAATGIAIGEYKGTVYERQLSKEDQDLMKYVSVVYGAYLLGGVPADLGRLSEQTYRKLLKDSKKEKGSGGIKTTISTKIK